MTLEGILAVPSPPALNLKGMEASVGYVSKSLNILSEWGSLDVGGWIFFRALKPYRLSESLGVEIILESNILLLQPQAS